jgi:hypothetical protein
MDSTQSFVKIYNISPQTAEDFEFDYTIDGPDILSELVPSQDDWGELTWGIDFEEYEYNPHGQTMHLVLNTKWESPIEWLRNASVASHYFNNKLITMATIQKDETRATGVAVMDGEILQNKIIWEMEPEEVSKHYDDDESDYDLDELDHKIWDSIGQFRSVCEKFYLGDPNEA